MQRRTLNWSSLITRHLRLRRPQSSLQATAVPVITSPPIPVAHNRVSTASDVLNSIIADRAAVGMPTDPGLIAVCERVSQEQSLLMQRPGLTGRPPSAAAHDHQNVTGMPPAAVREDSAVTAQPPPTTITEGLEPDDNAVPCLVSIAHVRTSGNMHCLQQCCNAIRLDIMACASLSAVQECACSLVCLLSVQRPPTQWPNTIPVLLCTLMLEYHQHENRRLTHVSCACWLHLMHWCAVQGGDAITHLCSPTDHYFKQIHLTCAAFSIRELYDTLHQISIAQFASGSTNSWMDVESLLSWCSGSALRLLRPVLLSCDAGQHAAESGDSNQAVTPGLLARIFCVISWMLPFRSCQMVSCHLLCVGKLHTVSTFSSVVLQCPPDSDATSCTAEPEVTACTAGSAGTAAHLTCTACTTSNYFTASWRVTAGQAEACDAVRATTGRACFVCYHASMDS